MHEVFLIICAVATSIVWLFIIEPWLKRRPSKGGFIRPDIHAKNKGSGDREVPCEI